MIAKRRFKPRARKEDDKVLVREKLLQVATEQFGKSSFDARDDNEAAG